MTAKPDRERSAVRRFFSGSHAPKGAGSSDGPAAGTQPGRLVIHCEGCGTVSEVDADKGVAKDEVPTGYFSRPCPGCGRELGVYVSRRLV